jgi:ArsR family transcriptional regulator
MNVKMRTGRVAERSRTWQSRRMSKQVSGLVVPAQGCCTPLAAGPLTDEQAGALAPMFKALGDPVRLRLLSMIASTAEVCVCDLTEGFAVSGPTISHHLRVLREAALVDCERRGTWVYYWVRPEAMRQLSGLLDIAAPAPA